MHDSVSFEDLGKTIEPFGHATYRQWERELERNLANKPLPPLPRVPVPTAQLKSEQPRIQNNNDGLPSSMQGPKPIALPLQQRQQLAPVNIGLFPPMQSESEWERRAQRMALRERLKTENPDLRSIWSPMTINEEKESKLCCCVM